MPAYALLSRVHPGDTLIADDGFTCLNNGDRCLVHHADEGLYVYCNDGKHFLDGQADDGEVLIGFTRP